MKAVVAAIIYQLFLKHSVGQMSAVPSEKIIHPMEDCESQMGCVYKCFLRKLKKLDYVSLK
jgi:hypothetical protein